MSDVTTNSGVVNSGVSEQVAQGAQLSAEQQADIMAEVPAGPHTRNSTRFSSIEIAPSVRLQGWTSAGGTAAILPI